MGFKIQNISGGSIAINDLGITLPTPGYIADLTEEPPADVAMSTDLLNFIAASSIAVLDPLDDVTPLSIAEGTTVVSLTNVPNYRIFGASINQLDDGPAVINAGLGTGIVEGGVLSIGAPNTTFSISDGQGIVVDNTTDPVNPTITEVVWTGLTNIAVTNIATQLITFIYITAGGSVIQSSTRPTRDIARDNLIVGVVVHVNNTIVDTVNQQQNISINSSAQIGDIITGIGFFNVSGNIFSANGANLNIDKSVGIMMGQGINWDIDDKNPHQKTLASLAPATFQYRFQDGTNGTTGITIDPTTYDLNGVAAAVPAKKYTVQRIYSFTSNNVKIQRGQVIYNSLKDAKAALTSDAFVTEPSIAANGLLRGFLIVKEDATDLTDIDKVAFVEAGKFGQSAGGGGGSTTDSEQVIFTVEKGSPGTINPGQSVYVSGYDATSLHTEVELTQSNSISTMPAIGIARDTITDTLPGAVILSGSLINQNTSSFSVGDELYVSDVTPGGLINTKPTGATFVQKVGIVSRVNASEGVIEVFGAGRANDLPNLLEDNIWIGDASGVPITLKNNYGATTNPTATDDSTAGYVTGSRWINETLDQEYVCLDATATSAVWVSTTQAGGSNITVQDEGTPLTTAVTLFNFAGAGVTVSEPIADQVLITIPGGNTAGDVPAALARRTTDMPITNAFVTVTFDTTDVETDDTVVDHDNVTNTSRITVKEAGLYEVYFQASGLVFTANGEGFYSIETRLIKNGILVAVPGGDIISSGYTGGAATATEINAPSTNLIVELAANDYLEVQIRFVVLNGQTGTVGNATSDSTFWVAKMIGAQGTAGTNGAAGPPGSGSTINVYEEGTIVPNSPFSELNFIGASVTATDAGAGRTNITINNAGGTLASQVLHVAAQQAVVIATQNVYVDVPLATFDLTTTETGPIWALASFNGLCPAGNTAFNAAISINGVTGSPVQLRLEPANLRDNQTQWRSASLPPGTYTVKLRLANMDSTADATVEKMTLYATSLGAPAGAAGTNGTNGTNGAPGVPGPTGSGTNINVYEEGVVVANSPFSVLNFVGDNVTATDAGAGQVNITIAGGGKVDRQQASSVSTFSTSATAVQDIPGMTLTTKNLGGTGAYILTFSCEFEHDKKDKNIIYTLTVGGTTVAQRQTVGAADKAAEWTLMSMSYLATGVANGTVIKARVSQEGADNLTIARRQLIIDGTNTSNVIV